MQTRFKVSIIIGLIISAIAKQCFFKIPESLDNERGIIVYQSIKFAIDVFLGMTFVLVVYYIYPFIVKKKKTKSNS